MASVSELETPTQSSVDISPSPSSKTFRVPTSPVDGKGEVVAFIGPGVEFKGEISYQGSVQIDGVLEGQIHTEGTLLVGEQAVLNAKVRAGAVISKGKMNGDIVANEKVQLLSTAIVDGSLKTPQLSMEIGVVFNGDISMSSGENSSEDKSSKYKSQYSYQKPNGNTSSYPNANKKNKGSEFQKDSSQPQATSSADDKAASASSSPETPTAGPSSKDTSSSSS